MNKLCFSWLFLCLVTVTVTEFDYECEALSHGVVTVNDLGFPPIWTSRRGMLASTMAPYLFPNAAKAQEPLVMADPGLSIATARVLQSQADEAASRVTPQHVHQYQTTGVCKVENVVSDAWIQALRDGCELAQDEAGPFAEYLHKPTDTGTFFTDLELARRLPLFSAFSLYGPAAAVAGQVLGSNTIRYLYDQLFVKQQGVSTVTPWHQDGGYWRVKGTQVASVFVPLDPVKADQGLQFVTASNTWPLHNPQHFCDGTPYRGTSLPPLPDIDAQPNKWTFQTFDLQPGDVLVFSSHTVHGGPGNWGRALSTRWVGDDATFWNRPGEGAVPTSDDVPLRDGQALAAAPQWFPTSWTSKATDKCGIL